MQDFYLQMTSKMVDNEANSVGMAILHQPNTPMKSMIGRLFDTKFVFLRYLGDEV